jgi:soluble lytic murein transglycosylase
MQEMQYFSQNYKTLLISALLCGLIGISCALPSAFGNTLSKTDVARYQAALKSADTQKWNTVKRATVRSKDPLISKMLTWLRNKSSGSGAKFAEIDSFLSKNPDWPHQYELRRRAETSMQGALSDYDAVVWFKRNPPLTIAGIARYARAMIAKGRSAEANAFVRQAWRDQTMNRAEEREFRKQFRKRLRTEDHIARLDRLIWDQRVGSARRQIRRVDRDHQHLALARLQLMHRAGGVDGAIARVPEHLRDHPGLVYERLRWRRRKGLSDSAVELLQNPPDTMKRPKKWWFERAVLSRRALREGNVTLAYRLARDHGQTDGAPHAEAEWLAGWIALRYLGDHKIALQHFKKLYYKVRYPVSRARGAYWAGRAVVAGTDLSTRNSKASTWYRLAAQYPTTFYGQLAIDRLRQPASVQLPLEPNPLKEKVAEFESRELVKLTRLIAQLGHRKLLKDFILHLSKTSKDPIEWALVAKLANEVGRNDLAINVAKSAIQQGVVLTATGYPKLPTSGSFAVSPALMHAVIRQESAFNPNAISSAGARGLMQLMPATARLVAKRLKVRHTKQRLLSDPTHNMKLGSAYLGRLKNNYDGSLILTLAAYNAGPGNVRRWVRMNGDPRDFLTFDAIDWIEAIPIPETRNYVQRVLENWTIYGYRFEDSFLPGMITNAMIGADTVDYP